MKELTKVYYDGFEIPLAHDEIGIHILFPNIKIRSQYVKYLNRNCYTPSAYKHKYFRLPNFESVIEAQYERIVDKYCDRIDPNWVNFIGKQQLSLEDNNKLDLNTFLMNKSEYDLFYSNLILNHDWHEYELFNLFARYIYTAENIEENRYNLSIRNFDIMKWMDWKQVLFNKPNLSEGDLDILNISNLDLNYNRISEFFVNLQSTLFPLAFLDTSDPTNLYNQYCKLTKSFQEAIVENISIINRIMFNLESRNVKKQFHFWSRKYFYKILNVMATSNKI